MARCLTACVPSLRSGGLAAVDEATLLLLPLLMLGCQVLRPVRAIAAMYRVPSRPPPTRHSHYVPGVLQPLKVRPRPCLLGTPTVVNRYRTRLALLPESAWEWEFLTPQHLLYSCARLLGSTLEQERCIEVP